MKNFNDFSKICIYFLTLLFLLNLSSVYAQWQKIYIDTLAVGAVIPIAADIENDGDIDIILNQITDFNTFAGKIVWYQSPNWIKRNIQDNFGMAKASDLNNDGQSDIITTNISTGEVVWYEYPSWDKHIISTYLRLSLSLEVIDLDKDDDTDIIVIGAKDNKVKIVWYEAPDWAVHTISEDFYSPCFGLKCVDVDLDNDIDIIAPTGDGIFWFEAPAWNSHDIDTLKIGRNIIDIGDIDNDGDIDVLVGESESGRVIYYENPTWSQNVVDWIGGPWGVVLADLDKDNDLDIVVGGQDDDIVCWYESPSWTKYIIDDTLDEASGLCVIDINGDSLTDIVACCLFGSQLVLYKAIETKVNSKDLTPKKPKNLILQQNFPNPFNFSTTIRFQLPRSEYITLKVFDILGNEIETLISGYKSAGDYEISYNENNLASGIYFYILHFGSIIEIKKMILLQ